MSSTVSQFTITYGISVQYAHVSVIYYQIVFYDGISLFGHKANVKCEMGMCTESHVIHIHIEKYTVRPARHPTRGAIEHAAHGLCVGL